ncbi:FtsK/SpoIIIE domain-containing protein [Microlunatus parietis]|uniref:S-DNA-T family DNA segregation ATPase FtsK/SpoIIIE n=1 Tax=Microlunatus parietis TaxID=682979 RepID=A0A7Y9I245_9ACTN|nr:FtsK/SpoIIIE domain-containing protein [Microlunatus parietis]NYE68816.1 S-DNA-T family DNA segregation ATPase FtsK/SpoIIIE [Microlunatus parietis]
MRLLIDLDGSPREIEVSRSTHSATLGDLVAETCGQRIGDDTTLCVDETAYPADTLLSDLMLLEGSTVSRAPLQRPEPISGWTATLSGGLDAGRVVPVPANRPLIIGRSPQADLSVDSASTSWEHATVTLEGDGVRIRDAGSTNGTLVDGRKIGRAEDDADEDDPDGEDEPEDDADKPNRRQRAADLIRRKTRREQPAAPRPDGVLVTEQAVITAGGVTILVRKQLVETPAPKPGSLHNLTPAGTAPFNRPPRPGRLGDPEPVQPPARKDVPDASRFSIAMILAPLVLAGAMVLVIGDPRFALLSALSPVLGIGTWIEGKHRRSKNLKAEEKRFDEAIETFRGELREAAAEGGRRSYLDTPDPATVIRRAAIPTMTLWERRPQAEDFLHLHAGVGDVPWTPPVENRSGGRLDEKIRAAMKESRLPAGAVEVDLSDAGVVGIVGERAGALAVARSLVAQASTQSGPADVTVGVFCDQGRDEDWAWTSWLPHLRRHGGGAGERWLSDNRSRSDELLRALRDGIHDHPTRAVLLVLDSDVLTEGRNAPARTLLGHGRGVQPTANKRPDTQVSGIVVASSEDQLPAACTVVIRVGADAAGTVTRPGDLKQVDDVVLAGISLDTARRTAMDLARFDDPDLVVPGAALPSLVRLPPLLDFEEISAETIRQSWSAPTGVSTPVGIGEGGAFSLDLVRDGPHGLVGGTTGSGKSEFLRSLVAGLAARNDPTRLTFILIDFKGGAAFKTCERLPHTIGTISNLDEQLANRALRALEAEMQYRQRKFAAAGEGVDNLDTYLATNPSEPMPRLLLVVDEFAMLAKEFPDVLSSLVSVGAVGRTLGVHMILATQRPAGVVNDDILANTNLRVALRVQSREDSSNVIGVPDAAAISRRQQGRAYVKLGQDDITPVQTALVTGQSEQQSTTKIDAHPVHFGRVEVTPRPQTSDDAPADLDLMIDAIVEAADAAGIARPRPVWPEPLGERVELAGFQAEGGADDRDPDAPPLPVVGGVDEHLRATFAISDDPDRQRQIPAGWDIPRGNLLLMGIPGSGTSTTLSTLALTLADAVAPEDLDLLILDMGSGDLRPLIDLPHTVGYVGSGSGAREQQVRFLRYLRTELDRRKADGADGRRTVVLIDGLAALREEFQDFEGIALLDSLYRAYADGPDLGLFFAASTTRAKSVPPAIDEVTTQKWLFRLADQYDYSAAGVKAHEAPAAVAGRCVLGETRLQTHVATPGCGLGDAVARIAAKWTGSQRKQDVVGQLPDQVAVAELGVKATIGGEPWLIPVGIREVDVEPQQLELYEGEHLLVTGPARSGKSTLLLSIAEVLRTADHAGPPIQVWGVGDRRSPLVGSPLLDRSASGADELAPLLAAARMHDGPLAVLIDDAERFDDSDQAISGLLDSAAPDLRIFAAGRSDDLRSLYSHWTKTVRKSRCGVLLQPNVDYDGELLGVTLPRRAPVAMTAGRGYACVAGGMALIQAASPSPAEPAGADGPAKPDGPVRLSRLG